jgi:hypothetical protein
MSLAMGFRQFHAPTMMGSPHEPGGVGKIDHHHAIVYDHIDQPGHCANTISQARASWQMPLVGIKATAPFLQSSRRKREGKLTPQAPQILACMSVVDDRSPAAC